QWPERYTLQHGANQYDPASERPDASSILEILEVVGALQRDGRIRHFGLSNENSYGAGCFASYAQALGLPRPVSVQMPFNLLEREDTLNMREALANSQIGLLTYSPLAGGALTGKYADFRTASKAHRLRKYIGFMTRYVSPASLRACEEYVRVAGTIDLPPAISALAWVLSSPSVTSTLIGPSSVKQLDECTKALYVSPLDEDTLTEMDHIYAQYGESTKGPVLIFDPDADVDDPNVMAGGSKEKPIDQDLKRALRKLRL
ncbi:aldo/keto reductase, partial [archaeon]